MTGSNLRELLDEATLSMPDGLREAPLTSIHGRVRRGRTLRAVLASAVLVAAAGALIPALSRAPAAVPPADPPPSAAGDSVRWDFGFLDGDRLTVFIDETRGCAKASDVRAAVTTDDLAVTVSLIGEFHQPSTCMALQVFHEITLPAPLGDRALRDGTTGVTRPLYERDQLPPSWNGKSFTAARLVRGGAFTGFLASYGTAPRELAVDVWGVDPTDAAQQPGAEALQVGPVQGYLFERDGTYRFAWQVRTPSGQAVGYEVTASPGLRDPLTRQEFLEVLDGFTWPG